MRSEAQNADVTVATASLCNEGDRKKEADNSISYCGNTALDLSDEHSESFFYGKMDISN